MTEERPRLTRREVRAAVDAALQEAPAGAVPLIAALCARIEGAESEEERSLLATAAFDRLFTLLYDAAGPLGTGDGTTLDQLLTAQLVVEIARDRLLLLSGEPAPDALREVSAERRALRELPLATDPSVCERDQELLQAIDRLQLHRAATLMTEESARERPGLALQLLAERFEEFADRGRLTFVGHLGAKRRSLWQQILRQARTLSGRERQRFVQELLDDLDERGEEALARAEDLDQRAALAPLRIAASDVRRGRLLAQREGQKQHAQRLRGLERRLRHQADALLVRARQKEQVGALGLRLTSAILFLAIAAILVALIWRLLGADAADTPLLEAIDLVASSLLLLEFGWRFVASGWSRRYALLHVLTDVLPSLFVLAIVFKDDFSITGIGLVLSLRFLRPLIEIYRLIAFTGRAADRVVEEQRELLNRNLILFEPTADEEARGRAQSSGLADLSRRLARRIRLEIRGLILLDDGEDRAKLALRSRSESLLQRLQRTSGGRRSSRVEKLQGRELRIEVLIEGLLTLEPEAVVDGLGSRSAARLSRALKALDLPLIRNLPFLRHIVPGLRGVEPIEGLARAGRGLGRALDEAMDRLRVFDDLQGIITGSQLVDRLGAAVVKATQRPAIRLLKFGLGTLLVGWIVGLIPALAHVHAFLLNVLSAMVWIGSVCLVFFALGQWLRRVAGEATELCNRVAEAQGINLLEREKLKRAKRDRTLLLRRILEPEARRFGQEKTAALAGFAEAEPPWMGAESLPPELISLIERVEFLYLDFLDGAVLHRSNVRTTEQALGNLDVRAIREHRLAQSKRERKRLEKLDLDQKSALPTGPALWFRFITDSLAQKTARLILAYNAHLVPLSERARLLPAERARGDAWLKTSQRRTQETRQQLDLQQLQLTRFHALHFLTKDAKRDERVAIEFGPAVHARLVTDRRQMVREVFSTRGFERLATSRRMINPYALYGRYLSKGRFLILPLRLFYIAFRLAIRGVNSFRKVLRALLRGEAHAAILPEDLHVTRESIIRKINRMHRPVFMELSRLRAQFDPEWHGLCFPGSAEPPIEFGLSQDDLSYVGSREYEKEHIREMGQRTESALFELSELLTELGWPEKSVLDLFTSDGDHALSAEDKALCRPAALSPAEEAESLRALCLAWVCDERAGRTAWQAAKELRDIGLRALGTEFGPERPLLKAFFPARARRFRLFLSALGPMELSAKERQLLRRAFEQNFMGLKPKLKRFDRLGGARGARAYAAAIFDRAIRHPTPYTQELVSLRTIHTLARLDLEHAREHVLSLAELGPLQNEQTPGDDSGGLTPRGFEPLFQG